MGTLHFATVYEAIADRLADATALVHGPVRRSWRDYEDRAARLAGVFAAHGLGRDSKVAICLYNGPEYLEAQFAAFKIRAVPVNVNYRYTGEEMRYLLDYADAEAVVFHGVFRSRIAEIHAQLPKLKCLVEIGDGLADGAPITGALDCESAIAETAPRPREPRSGDDVYMLFTGGTTGMPKGAMYAVEELLDAQLMGYAFRGVAKPEGTAAIVEAAAALRASGAAPVSLVACPLMHGTGMWGGAMIPALMGGTVVTLPEREFNAHALWRAVEAERVSDIVIVGDAFAKPMLTALEEAERDGRPYDLSSVKIMLSSGVMWTQGVKAALLERASITLIDSMGSSEGIMGRSVTTRDAVAGTAKFALDPGVKVFDEQDREIAPGTSQIGRIGTAALRAKGYYKDPTKTEQTFRVIDGVRYCFPGDWAMVEADGSITLLGRGSQCINTGGEKVFPEEVEEALKRHPAVYDCLVVGVPDARFGEAVAAVVSLRPGAMADAGDLQGAVRGELAGYKVPRRLVMVDEVRRAPNGKADYRWAKQMAAGA